MALMGRRRLAVAMIGASLFGLAGCGGGAGNTSAGGNAAAAAPTAAMSGPPAQPMAQLSGPTRYCGVIHNATVNQDEQGEIDVDPGAGFSGSIILNGSNLQGGAGRFQGTVANGLCSGVSSSGGLAFWGSCPSGGEFDGSYSINGQQGAFRMSASACH